MCSCATVGATSYLEKLFSLKTYQITCLAVGQRSEWLPTMFYGNFLSQFLHKIGSQAFDQLKKKVASGNFSVGNFLVNNSSV